MINTVIFDFDGVIEDNYEHHFELSTKQIRGLTREEHRMLFEGNIHEQREKLRDRDTGFDLPKIFNESKVTLKTREEVRDSLVKLASQYRLGIISSAMEYGLNTYLLNNGLNNLFSFVYGKETHWSKVEKFEMAKNNFGLDNDNIVFVTDT